MKYLKKTFVIVSILTVFLGFSCVSSMFNIKTVEISDVEAAGGGI